MFNVNDQHYEAAFSISRNMFKCLSSKHVAIKHKARLICNAKKRLYVKHLLFQNKKNVFLQLADIFKHVI